MAGKRGQAHYKRTPEQRFWDKVRKTPTCWWWTAYIREDGHGQLEVNGHNIKAHRFSYALHYGPIPPDMLVLHNCDNAACVNPDHLYLGTQVDNMQDEVRKHERMRLESVIK